MKAALYDRIHNAILGIIEPYAFLTDEQVVDQTRAMTEAAVEALDVGILNQIKKADGHD